jgi:transposase-like protein
MSKARKSWTDQEKTLRAMEILEGKKTIDVVRKELDAPSYQVAAWVGLEAEKLVQRGMRFRRPEESPIITAAAAADVSEKDIEKMSNEDRVILQLLIKKFVRQIST